MNYNKLDGIQILRGYAAVLVVVTHLWSAGRISRTLNLGQIGGLGVDIFFIISGFIMCYSLKERIAAGESIQFLKKRIIRIYPIYWLVLIPFLLQYVHNCSIKTISIDPLLVVGNVLLLPSFISDANYKMLVGPAWTLVYELLFYMMFAGAMLLSNSKDHAIRIVTITIVAMVSLVNIFGIKGERLQWSNFQYMIGDTLLINFVIGCVCFLVWRKYARALFGFWTAVGSTLVLTLVSQWLARHGYPRIIALAIPACAIVLTFLNVSFKATKLTNHLVFLGTASYSIYLVHSLLASLKYLAFGKYFQENDLTGLLLTTGAIAFGYVFYTLVENPITRALSKSKARYQTLELARARDPNELSERQV